MTSATGLALCSQPFSSASAEAAGERRLRHLLRWAAGVSTVELARVMGASVAMIDRTYAHLACDSEASIRARLEAWSASGG